MSEARLGKRELLGLLAVLAVALGVRVAFLAERVHAPDFAAPAIDAGFHDDWARTLVDPDWQRPEGLPDPEIGSTPYLRPPGYPLFLAGVYALCGDGYLAPRVANVVLGLASVLLAWAIARRAYGHAAGLLAAAWIGTHWILVYFEGELHAPALFIALELGFVALLQRWRERPGLARAGLAGALCGLAALVRPNALLFLPVAVLWMIWQRRRAPSPSARRHGCALALLGGAALAIAPVTARNFVVSGELVLVTANAGVNLWIGNHPGATGTVVAEVPGLGAFETCYDWPALVAELEDELGRELSSGDVSSWFAERAWAWIAAHPRAFLSLTLHKAGLFWGPTEVSHNKVVELERRHSRVLRLLPRGFPIAAAAAAAGLALVLLERRRARRLALREPGEARHEATTALLVGLVLAYFLSVLPFFAAARYRVPALPLLVIVGAHGVASLARAARGGRLAPLGAGGAAALGVWLLAHATHGPGADPAKWHMDRGRALSRVGRPAEALVELEAALGVLPASASADARFSAALARAAQGDVAGASTEYRAALAADPEHLKALANLASLLAQGGQVAEARPLYERSTRVDPDFHPGWSGLGLAWLAQGRPERAVEPLRRAVELEPADPSYRASLARALAASGRAPEAVAELERAVELARAAGRARLAERLEASLARLRGE